MRSERTVRDDEWELDLRFHTTDGRLHSKLHARTVEAAFSLAAQAFQKSLREMLDKAHAS